MNSLLSTLSGQFGKSLLLSTLLPVVVFVLLALVLVVPHVPATVPVLHWVRGLDSEWQLAALTLAIVLLTAVLHNLNGPIIRFYEGYPWCDSYVGRWRAKVHRRGMASAKSRWRGLWTLLLTPEAQKDAGYSKVEDHWNALARTLNSEYPDAPDAVLPTRLGNVIRSFESYPWRQYRMKAITLWPRLSTLLDESYAGMIDDAKSSLDFMLNASLLCGVLAALVALVHLGFPVGLATAGVLVPLAIQVVALGGLAFFFYLAAIPRAQSWGMLVKGGFDLFRWKLLESLGYRFRPDSLKKERELWAQISERLILSDMTITPLPAYERKAAAAMVVPAKDLELSFARGASRASAESLEVTIRVHNPDPARTATGVIVLDALPEAWIYEWGSAAASTGAVEITGANPYKFKIADLAPGAAALVTYRAVPACPQSTP
jgi:hypothetical protein